ncbi:MAG: DUF4321 domain-containing protein [Gemmatimonadota bacterium]|nr:DUF4321 domain-containing protein [Gemmatimonadota bacterium]MDH3368130.1 DUF4321 domain-containing protein [Gemmatimonadota bacterium]MDH3479732.1 DUF4321 domain-containing protein [Gemmatimonadota bacterium]MDH3569254.1 DUF4321 domain-containing protein [Gemmatimonadota bacterium]MDH5549471.1 DUF4321 domain-containing protein [Gemmatimonadota bacterium]
MPIGPRRPLFYVSFLTLGFVIGGFLSALLARFLPESPAKEFITWTVAPSVGPVHLNLIIFSLTLGPLALQVSLLGLLGVVLAYLLARSLF